MGDAAECMLEGMDWDNDFFDECEEDYYDYEE